MDKKYRAIIQDDAHDMTYGPAETYEQATKRLSDALSAARNIGGSVEEVKS